MSRKKATQPQPAKLNTGLFVLLFGSAPVDFMFVILIFELFWFVGFSDFLFFGWRTFDLCL